MSEAKAKKKRFQPEVTPALCKDCGYCLDVCETDVFENSELFNTAGYQYIVATHPENCTGCLKCFMICPDFAVSVAQVEDTPAQSEAVATPAKAAEGSPAQK